MNNIQEKPTKQESFPRRPAQMVFLVTFADVPAFKKFLSHVSKSMTGTSTSCSLFGDLKSLELKWPQPATMQRFPAEKMMRSDNAPLGFYLELFLMGFFWIASNFGRILGFGKQSTEKRLAVLFTIRTYPSIQGASLKKKMLKMYFLGQEIGFD